MSDTKSLANREESIYVTELGPAQLLIAVVGHEYWPLPWYLRSFETVGYWPTPIQDMTELPIVFAMPLQVHPCDTLLKATHTKLPRGLRTNVSVTLYLRNDIWQRWIHTTEE